MKRNSPARLAWILLAIGASVIQTAWAAESKSTTIVDTGSYWRAFYWLAPPAVKNGPSVRELPTLISRTALPPEDWKLPAFDAGNWESICGEAFPGANKLYGMPDEALNAGFIAIERSSPAIGLTCLRTSFRVTDPAAVRALSLKLTYRGGIAVYLNGKELARGHLAAGASADALAEDYPAEAWLKADGTCVVATTSAPGKSDDMLRVSKLRVRELTVPVPAQLLVSGTNVLALEIHRAACPEAAFNAMKALAVPSRRNAAWNTCELIDARLTADSPSGMVPNVGRPAGFQLWNSQLLNDDFDLDYGNPCEPLQPVRMCAPLNGKAAGKVVLGCDSAIKGLQAAAGELSGPKGKLAPDCIQIFYALPTSPDNMTPPGRYTALPTMMDGLTPNAPPEIPVYAKTALKAPFVRPERTAPAFGAVVPIWISIRIPANAAEGNYRGELSVTAAGLAAPLKVPIELNVYGWRCPDPAQFHTIVDFVQSPESVALNYDVPLWSDQHWKLLEKSLDCLGEIGNWSVYIPIICQTNLGNEQSMVRWVKQRDGSHSFDYRIMEKYLDLAGKRMGKPRMVCLQVWERFVGGYLRKATGLETAQPDDRNLKACEIPVTEVDADSGAITTLMLSGYNEATLPEWKKLVEGLQERLAKRGLDKSIVLGLMGDETPMPEIGQYWSKLLPGTGWTRAGHFEWPRSGDAARGFTLEYQFNVAPFGTIKDLANGQFSCYGWSRPYKRALFPRTYDPTIPTVMSHLMPEVTITGDQRGFGRIGLDFWPVLKDAKGNRTASVHGRHPKSNWRGAGEGLLEVFAPPGPDGALLTAGLEHIRQGLQEAEARIFLEMALTDAAQRAKLGEDLAKRAENLLNERAKATVPWAADISNAGLHNSPPTPARFGSNLVALMSSIHRVEDGLFFRWYKTTGWLERNNQLYALAAEAARALGK